jgi:hypothetical protein
MTRAVEDVWDAITSAERIPRRFLPVSGDLRLGRYQLQGNAGGEITGCNPPRHLRLSMWRMLMTRAGTSSARERSASEIGGVEIVVGCTRGNKGRFMFVGHYGVSYAAKAQMPRVPLWVWFIAVQWLDVVWSLLVILDVEKMRIVPGYTEANAYDLYYMPYTHSLPGAIVLSLVLGGIVAAATPGARGKVVAWLRPPHFRIGCST